MEPIGQKFKDARKEKGLFIEQVSRETNISKKYIEAIEEENFEEFPGEAYLLGFLRSYAGYLGLNVEEIISIYKNTKIQEQPVPEELFVPKPKIPPLVYAGAAVFLLIAAAGLIFFLVFRGGSDNNTKVVMEKPASSSEKSSNRPGAEYEMTTAFIEKRFEEGDSVIVKYRDVPFKIVLVKTGKQVSLDLPDGRVELAKGKELFSDLNGDGNNDIKILVRDIDEKGKGAVLKFDKTTEAPAVVSSGISSEQELSDVSAAAVAAGSSAPAPAAGAAMLQSRKQGETVILESETKEPFTLNLSFRGYCLMRYESDGGIREERYFHKGDTFRLGVSGSIRVWISNAAAVTATVNNAEYSFGRAGEVSAKVIKWNDKPGGGYVVKAHPLY
ncbi:MAG: helix-turn-helix domain-containing protein [Spirochaetia bacterium]|jgi:cytoskeletal protein RodZ|nr:helix-turn-helix domain-containing protein [Spirochaetia bacterium]